MNQAMLDVIKELAMGLGTSEHDVHCGYDLVSEGNMAAARAVGLVRFDLRDHLRVAPGCRL